MRKYLWKKWKMKRPYYPKTWFFKITENKIRLWREKAFPDNLALDGNQFGSRVRYPLLYNSCHRISSHEQQPFVLSLLVYNCSPGRLTAFLLRVSTGSTRYWLGVLFVQRFCLIIHFETTSCSWQNSTPFDCWSRKHLHCFALCCVIFPIRLVTNSWSFWLHIQSTSITGMCYWQYLSSVPHAAKSSFPSPTQIFIPSPSTREGCKV